MSSLPIADYDALDEQHVIAQFRQLSQIELAEVEG